MDFTKEVIVFAGELISMSKKQAKSLVFSLGGETQRTVTKRTTRLVVGMFTYKSEFRNDVIKEEQKVKQLAAAGSNVDILTEQEFLVLMNQQLVKLIRMDHKKIYFK